MKRTNRPFYMQVNENELVFSIQQLIDEFDRRISSFPQPNEKPGSSKIKVCHRRDSSQCFIYNPKNEKYEYVSKKDPKLLSAVRLDYYQKELKMLQKKKETLEKACGAIEKVLAQSAFGCLSKYRKELVEPLPYTSEGKTAAWRLEHGDTGTLFPERLIFTTVNGEKVRSKSEVLIADELARRHIEYKYEQPVKVNGVVFRPDFTIFNKNTSREIIWEHVGLLDDAGYREDFVRKYNAYLAGDYTLGVNLFFTFECEKRPLLRQSIENIIECMGFAEDLNSQTAY